MLSPVLCIDIWFFLEQGAGLDDLGKPLLIEITLWCFCIGKLVMPKEVGSTVYFKDLRTKHSDAEFCTLRQKAENLINHLVHIF